MKTWCAVVLLFFFSHPAARSQSSLHLGKQQFKNQFLEYINIKRAQGCNCGITYMKPVQPLIWNEQLATAAAAHAGDMYQNQYFSHQSRDGSKMQDRLIKAGYNYKGYQSYAIGENIAYGQQSISEVITVYVMEMLTT